MASESKVGSSMVIKKLIETSLDGKEKYSTQKFSKVKVTALPQDIYDVATAMGNVLAYEVKEIIREDTNLIVNE